MNDDTPIVGEVPRFSERQQSQEPRKVRREKEAYQAVLMSFANTYIAFKEKHKKDKKNKLLIKNELQIQEHNWKSFVHKWNANPKHRVQLRIDEFRNLIIYKENLDEKR